MEQLKQDAIQGAEPASLAQRRLAWTRFWAQGALHSLGTTFAGNYADAIGTFWQLQFAACNKTDRVLDLGCGNGPLAKILIDLFGEESPQWNGIDLANPRPAWLVEQSQVIRDRMIFRGGVLAEELPFDDGSFDLVVSQFGIEYSDLNKSLPELVRVLRPEGRVALVVHHADSLPVYVSRQELRHLDFLVRTRYLDFSAEMLPFIARLAESEGRHQLAQDENANATRARFDAVHQEISARIKSEPIPDLLADVQIFVQECFRLAAAGSANAALERLTGYRSFLFDFRLRLEDLVRSALDEAGVLALQERLASLRGRKAEKSLTPLNVNGRAFGWAIRA